MIDILSRKIEDRVKNFNYFELEIFVRNRLGQKIIFEDNLNFKHEEEHLRFDFGGLKPINVGDSVYIKNNDILMLFKDFGLYDNYISLYISTYKGSATVMYEEIKGNDGLCELDFSGFGTVEIIVKTIETLYIEKCKYEEHKQINKLLNEFKKGIKK